MPVELFPLTRTLVTLSALLAAPSVTADELVRFEYRAPPGCPEAEVFENRVRARTARVRLGGPDELARTFAIEVRRDEADVTAQLTFIDARGASVVRAVRGETCDEVVSAIALVTALAIDAGPTEDAKPATATPAGSVTRAPEPQRPPPVAKPLSMRVPEPDVLVWSAGVETNVTSWLGPPPTVGLGVFAELGAYAGASGRLMVLGAMSSNLVEPLDPAASYRRGDFVALLARLEGCPVAWPLGGGFRVLPCAGVGLGALRGKGAGDAVQPERSRTIFWADLVPALRVDWTLSDTLVFFGQGELGVPLVRHSFYLDGPRQDVFVVPALGAGVSLGLAWRFP